MPARPTRKRMYRTMQGRLVDIEKLRTSNEDVRAVGNMNVNARGDVIGLGGIVAKTKEQVMREYYEAPRGRAEDTPKIKPARRQPIPKAAVVQSQTMNPMVKNIKTTETKTVEQFKPKVEAQPEEKKGIDAALDGID